MWCNRCESEYEDHVKICAECGEELTEVLLKEETTEIEPVNDKKDYQEFVKLINCKDKYEADIIMSLLEANNIQSMISYESSGSYLNITYGFNYQGVDVSVPTHQLDEAMEIMKEPHEQDLEDDFELVHEGKNYEKDKRTLIRVMVWIFFLIPVGVGMIVGLIELLKMVSG